MIDPLTALSVATTAVSQIRQLVSAGQDATSALSKFAGAVSDISYAAEKAKNPSIWKSISGSAEQEAIEIFSAQKKMEQMKRDVEVILQYTYGQKGLDDYKNILRKVREQRKKNEYRRQEIKDALILWTLSLLIICAGVLGLALVIWWLGVQQGKW